MADLPKLPQYNQQLTNDGQIIDRVWYKFFDLVVKNVAQPTSWTTATRPIVQAGYTGYNTTTSKFEGFDGTNWVNLN